jgi:light-regulated signal transduction histidine kinase (bacteriophytochrome)
MKMESSSFACPIDAMADGLHAMAQSLTVLRGALGACNLQGTESAKVERYLEMATKQSVTMNDLFAGLRAVLDSADGKANLEKVEIGELIRFVVQDLDSDLRECGAKVSFIELDAPVQILGDVEKTERAIRAAIRVAISASTRDGQIQLSVRSSKGRVEVIVETNTFEGKKLGFADRLNLSLIESNIRSQGGHHKFVENPVAVLFFLPAYRAEPVEPVLDASCFSADTPTLIKTAGASGF